MNREIHKSFQTKTKRILRECKAFVDGSHFVYASGNHGDFYVNKDALYMHPRKMDDVSCMLYEVSSEAFGKNVDVILAPTYGGVILGQQLAYNYSLDTNRDVLFAYSELDVSGTYRVLRRGFSSLMKNARVIVVDDIVTTGNTLLSLAQAAVRAGAHVLGASVLCDRGKVRNLKFYPMDKKGLMSITPFELQIVPLLEMDLNTFAPDKCPFCAAGRPIDPEFGEGHLQDPFKTIRVDDVAASVAEIRKIDGTES